MTVVTPEPDEAPEAIVAPVIVTEGSDDNAVEADLASRIGALEVRMDAVEGTAATAEVEAEIALEVASDAAETATEAVEEAVVAEAVAEEVAAEVEPEPEPEKPDNPPARKHWTHRSAKELWGGSN